MTDLDPDDVSVDASYPRNDVFKILESLNISVSKSTSTTNLNRALSNRLQQDHPIHKFLKALNLPKLKEIASKEK